MPAALLIAKSVGSVLGKIDIKVWLALGAVLLISLLMIQTYRLGEQKSEYNQVVSANESLVAELQRQKERYESELNIIRTNNQQLQESYAFQTQELEEIRKGYFDADDAFEIDGVIPDGSHEFDLSSILFNEASAGVTDPTNLDGGESDEVDLSNKFIFNDAYTPASLARLNFLASRLYIAHCRAAAPGSVCGPTGATRTLQVDSSSDDEGIGGSPPALSSGQITLGSTNEGHVRLGIQTDEQYRELQHRYTQS